MARHLFLDVDIDTDEVERWVIYAGYKVRDMREPLRESIHNVVIPAVLEQIASQGSRSGEPYEELTMEYSLDKMNDVGFLHPILVRSGKMLNDLKDSSSVRVFREYAWYRPDNPYMHWHQTGGYVEGRPPRRVVLDLIVDDYREIQNIFESWLAELRDLNRRRTGDAPLPAFNIADHFEILT